MRELDRFISRVHRRLIVVRVLERAGLCAAIASAFAAVLAMVMIVRGQSAFALVSATLALGASLGLIWGCAQRPTRFDAAVETDRQLGLDDLLATALTTPSNAEWAAAVVAVASERCRTLSPSQVLVHRYGGRAWTGIGLSGALVLTIGLLSSVSSETPVRATESIVSGRGAEIGGQDIEPVAASPAMASREVKSSGMESGEPFRREDLTTADETPAVRGEERPLNGGPDAGPGAENASQNASAKQSQLPPRSSGVDGADGDQVSSGGGRASRAHQAPPANASPGVQNAAASPQPPRPWDGPSWSQDAAAATEAVRAGRVADSYRDVLGEYFRGGENSPDSR